ncbi:uncharacterized protein BX663DRAFT_425727, partial [Cokeromyces recurvatus]|uniref:uncharacterized protein n=1 Tax=Cokeromyces recurvatus TaxID=90255 RepID=UPI00221E5206
STFIIYISQNESDSRFTPIVINIQEVVDSDSMSSTILFSTLAFKKNKILPTVLIIPSKPINKEELNISEDSFLIPLKSTFWAYKCFLFSPSGISSADDRPIPTTLIALCQFILSPNKTFSLYEAQSHSICFICEAKSYDEEE